MGDAADVLVVGAGPAGATIARLLAQRGYAVLLLKGPPSRHPDAGSLPPAMNSVFETVGVAGDIAGAGFYPNRGLTSWRGGEEPLVESYADGPPAYHVERCRLDALLVSLAERAGVRIERNSRAPRVALEAGAVDYDGGVSNARFVVDATGRAGLLARQIKRYWDPRYRSVALCAILRGAGGWDTDPHHSLMEVYDRGWAWSVPLDPHRRYVSFTVDASAVRGESEQAFRAELDRTIEFRRLFAESGFEGPPWCRDASLYRAGRYAGASWMLVGDAGSFADPLSSSGIEKAMRSAWMGAGVIGACLDRPDSAEAAIEAYNSFERNTWLEYARGASRLSLEMAELFHTRYWRERAVPAAIED